MRKKLPTIDKAQTDAIESEKRRRKWLPEADAEALPEADGEADRLPAKQRSLLYTIHKCWSLNKSFVWAENSIGELIAQQKSVNMFWEKAVPKLAK